MSGAKVRYDGKVETRVRDLLILTTVAIVSSGVVWTSVGLTKIYENFDGPYYAVVAKCGYDKVCIGSNFEFPLPLEYYAAHFPLYPALMAGVNAILGTGLLQAGALINLVASAVGAGVIYWIWTKNKWGSPVWAGIVWLFLWPRMWAVRSVVSPETTFILLTMVSLFAFERKSFWIAGLAGAMAALTKSPGILLFVAYGLIFLRKPNSKIWPVLLIPSALGGLFWWHGLGGDFWAYFHSGDNIHLQWWPFRVFDSSQPWVGNFWLEDVLWIYVLGTVGVLRAYKKSPVWGMYGVVFLISILFVSHRDISRYSLPLVPVVLLGLFDILKKEEMKWVLAAMIVPMFFYTVNFLSHNTVAISNWAPFL